ncbi:MAG: hypothetical protein JRE71_12120 [Deltaproteobacteria bacterium]|nr:hypothetical protein [Deltaproteobacteria bacterium]
MSTQTEYRVLSGTIGIAFILFGLVLTASFFGYQEPGSTPGIPTGPVGHYFIAFAGCALVGWGGGLIGAAREPRTSRSIATATVLALVLMSVVRMAAWVVGDYHAWLGELPRGEAAFFLLLALAFLWLRPSTEDQMVTRDREVTS